MKIAPLIASLFLALVWLSTAAGDFNGPESATFAASPNGGLLVRVKAIEKQTGGQKSTDYEITYYNFDAAKDSYVVRSKFRLPVFGHLLYVSDSGDLISVVLDEKDSIRVHSSKGKLEKTWSLADFLKQHEIDNCAQTGSTLQWLEE